MSFWNVQRVRRRREWTDGGMILTGENKSAGREICHSDTLYTTSHTWIVLGSKAGVRGDRPATNLKYLQRFSSHRAVKSVGSCYKNQSVNVV